MTDETVLLTQGNVTVAVGTVPVIHDNGTSSPVAQAVNFLRAGAPAVQMLIDYTSEAERALRLGHIEYLLISLREQGKEIFEIQRGAASYNTLIMKVFRIELHR